MDRGTKRIGPPSLGPEFKLWLSAEGSKSAFGDGKWRLLKAIQQEGSLRAATASLGISYRKAWGDLRKAEQSLGVKLIERHRGGTGGGETRLTDAGREWVHAYDQFRTRVVETIATEFETAFGLRK